MTEEDSKTGTDDPTSAPVADEPGKDNAPDTPQAAERPKVTRLFRGRTCEVTRVTKNTVTGAIYDHILFPKQVTNRKNGKVETVFLGFKQRRPGTGVVPEDPEIEIEQELLEPWSE